jgi:hypothetical protein
LTLASGIDVSTVNSALVAAVAVVTLLLGFYQRQASGRTRELENKLNQRREVFELEFATKEEVKQILERLVVLETRMDMYHGSSPLEEEE